MVARPVAQSKKTDIETEPVLDSPSKCEPRHAGLPPPGLHSNPGFSMV